MNSFNDALKKIEQRATVCIYKALDKEGKIKLGRDHYIEKTVNKAGIGSYKYVSKWVSFDISHLSAEELCAIADIITTNTKNRK